MTLPYHTASYTTWAPLVARIIIGAAFVFAATMKIPGTESFNMEVGMTAAVGVPFAYLAVILAGILEAAAGLALIFGYQTRLAAFALVLFVALLTVLFHWNFSDMMAMGSFISHLELIAALLYISVYGAKSIAVQRD